MDNMSVVKTQTLLNEMSRSSDDLIQADIFDLNLAKNAHIRLYVHVDQGDIGTSHFVYPIQLSLSLYRDSPSSLEDNTAQDIVSLLGFQLEALRKTVGDTSPPSKIMMFDENNVSTVDDGILALQDGDTSVDDKHIYYFQGSILRRDTKLRTLLEQCRYLDRCLHITVKQISRTIDTMQTHRT